MEEILYHLGCIKVCKQWDIINYLLLQDFFHQFLVNRFPHFDGWIGLLSPCENLPQDAGTIFTSAFASAAEDATADFIVLVAADGGGHG